MVVPEAYLVLVVGVGGRHELPKRGQVIGLAEKLLMQVNVRGGIFAGLVSQQIFEIGAHDDAMLDIVRDPVLFVQDAVNEPKHLLFDEAKGPVILESVKKR